MQKIIEKAKEILKKYGSDELDFLVSRFGIEVYEVLEDGKIEEVYFPELKAIALKPGLNPQQRNYLLSHALGHHLFHQKAPNRDYLLLHEKGLFGSLELGKSERARKEKEADLFASYLLIPEEKLNQLLEEEWVQESHFDPTPQLAEEFQVPEELMRKRLEFEKNLRHLT